ncbi:unnamed protein product [Cochlearia groenlandica]
MNQETKTEYEPDRIPPSVFATTMTSKQEWSVQSNESLFSIHMADQSFSKMYKSGELSNFDYTPNSYITNNNTNDNKTNLTQVGTKEVNVETGSKAANLDSLTVVSKPDPTPQIPISPTKSYHSDNSNNSTASFAFPILPEHQQDRKTQFNMNSRSGKTEMSSLSSNNPKSGNGGGWLSCLFCFSAKN